MSNCALIDWNQTDMDSYNDRKGLQGVRRLFFWVFWIFWTKIDLDENRFELPTILYGVRNLSLTQPDRGGEWST